ncbi:MAG TPA: hypothetical protein VMF30_00155, partial [Pirellulales bacterium]|nr:hypothetical protein [Pirellulales bacterium]
RKIASKTFRICRINLSPSKKQRSPEALSRPVKARLISASARKLSGSLSPTLRQHKPIVRFGTPLQQDRGQKSKAELDSYATPWAPQRAQLTPSANPDGGPNGDRLCGIDRRAQHRSTTVDWRSGWDQPAADPSWKLKPYHHE